MKFFNCLRQFRDAFARILFCYNDALCTQASKHGSKTLGRHKGKHSHSVFRRRFGRSLTSVPTRT
jgi:hypothetical protein